MVIVLTQAAIWILPHSIKTKVTLFVFFEVFLVILSAEGRKLDFKLETFFIQTINRKNAYCKKQSTHFIPQAF